MDKKFYDGLIIFDTKGEREGVITEITGIIKENDGLIEAIDEWGIRTLAYPIKKRNEGFYLLIRFTAKPPAVSLISKVLRTSEPVIRFLIVKRKNPLPVETGGEDKKEVEKCEDTQGQ